MQALTYHGAKDVRVETVPDPALMADDDIILRITATAICGSDLHLYRGKIPGLNDGDVLGHEFMGIIEDAGPAVTAVKKGDRVVIPFTISCGECVFCNMDLFAACASTNPGRGTLLNKKGLHSGAGMFGYTEFYGGYPGGQAELVRVPKANVGPLKVPDGMDDEKVLFLSDILPTGYQAVLNAGVKKGSSLAIFGAGPVGLMSAACARMLGAEKIYMIDHHDYRLAFAQEAYGVIPLNFDEIDDPAEYIVEDTGGYGVDGTVEAVGFENKGNKLETVMTNLKLEGASGFALRQCIAATRRGGTVSVPGVYAGPIHAFLYGDIFEKGLTLKGGQTHVQKFMPELLEHVQAGRLSPDIIITHRLPLAQAAEGYKIFDEKQEDCRKVVLRPS